VFVRSAGCGLSLCVALAHALACPWPMPSPRAVVVEFRLRWVRFECITLLIQAGADVNTAILDISPLHIAASRNLLPLVQLLLNYGADVYLRDNLGRRPKELVSTTSNIWKVLNNYELNPRSLADSCRLSILRFLVVGRNFENIRNIGLPHKVVHFILNKF